MPGFEYDVGSTLVVGQVEGKQTAVGKGRGVGLAGCVNRKERAVLCSVDAAPGTDNHIVDAGRHIALENPEGVLDISPKGKERRVHSLTRDSVPQINRRLVDILINLEIVCLHCLIHAVNSEADTALAKVGVTFSSRNGVHSRVRSVDEGHRTEVCDRVHP